MFLIISWAGKARQVFLKMALLAELYGSVTLGELVNAANAN